MHYTSRGVRLRFRGTPRADQIVLSELEREVVHTTRPLQGASARLATLMVWTIETANEVSRNLPALQGYLRSLGLEIRFLFFVCVDRSQKRLYEIESVSSWT